MNVTRRILKWATFASAFAVSALAAAEQRKALPRSGQMGGVAERPPSVDAVLNPSPQQLAEEGQWEEAILRFRAGLLERPGDLTLLFGLSKTLALAGRREEGLTLLEVAYTRERVAKRKAELERRLQVLAHLFLSNAQQQVYFEGVTLLLSQRYADALARFEKVNVAEPYQADVLFRLAQLNVLQGNPETAVEFFNQANRFSRPTPARRLWLARAYDLKGDMVRARQEFGSLPASLESSLKTYWYADFLRRSGKLQVARLVLERGLKKDPQEIRLWRLLVEVRAELLNQERSPAGTRREGLKLIQKVEGVLRQGGRVGRIPEDEPATLFFSDNAEEARAQTLLALETLRSRFSLNKGSSSEENTGPDL